MESSFHAVTPAGGWEGVAEISQHESRHPWPRKIGERVLRAVLRRTCRGAEQIQLQWRDQGYLEGLLAGHDLLHFHWVDGGVASIFEIAGLKVPVVWTLHDMRAITGGHYYLGFGSSAAGAVNYDMEEMRRNPVMRLNLRVKRLVMGNKNIRYVAPSRWMKEEALKAGLFPESHLHHVPYGIAPAGDIAGMRDEARARHGVAPSDRVLLYGADAVGYPRKGHDLLMGALENWDLPAAEQQRLWFYTFGKGTFEPPASVRHRHRHFGHIATEAEMNRLFAMADVFVAPSREDNLPNVVLESLRCGTPVVAFEIGGMPDMIEDGVNGRLVCPFDIGALGHAIRELLNDPRVVEADRRSEWSRKVLAHFSLEKQLAGMKEVYRAASSD